MEESRNIFKLRKGESKMKYKTIMLVVACATLLVSCGRNDKEIVKQELILRTEYVKSEKFLTRSSEVEKDLQDIRVKLLGPKNIGETEFALMQDKYSNDEEIVKLQRDFQQAWNEAFAKQMKNTWGRKK